jgi:hypothetical protein
MSRLLALGLALMALLCWVGCGSSGGDATAGPDPSLESAYENIPAHRGDWAGLKKAAGKHSDRLLIPRGISPDEVVIKDLKVGTGPAITPGDVFGARYVSFDYQTGERLERNWGEDPWRLRWKIGELVDGWEPGLKGIRAGGIRELILPSRFAYDHGPMVYIVEAAEIEPE